MSMDSALVKRVPMHLQQEMIRSGLQTEGQYQYKKHMYTRGTPQDSGLWDDSLYGDTDT